MTTSSTFAIVGGGLAGAKAAEALRDKDFDGHVVLFAAEEHLPYERPPLSKEFLLGKKQFGEFTAASSAWYRDHHVELQLGTEVSAVDPGTHTVSLPDGTTVNYDKLLLATGSTPRRPPIPGADADGVHYLRTIDDAQALSSLLSEGASLAIVGAGWIGLEVAAGARERGASVTVVETAEVPLMSALGREAGEMFAAMHRDHGVDLRLGATVDEITATAGRATGLRLGDGSTVAADAVLVAVGAAANIGLAETGRPGHRRWRRTRRRRRCAPATPTSSPSAISRRRSIHCSAREYAPNTGRMPSSSRPSRRQACSADRRSTTELPYFFTDQYDLGMEYVGYAPEYDQVVFRGDVEGREFTAFWLDDANRVLAGMNVNIWEGLDDIKSLIRSREPVDPDQLVGT